MAVRTVTVRLRADVSQYTRSLRQASDRTSRLAGAGAKVGAVMLTGFAVAAAAAARFDKALSNVRAVSGASSAEMAKLRASALAAAKTTQYTATQAADAQAELARAGISVADITGGALKGSLALAASGQLDLSESAIISAQAMNTFGLKGKDVTHVADVLSAAANKSASNVHGLGMSLRMGGLLAHQTGLSIEETVGTLAAFADHALIGSDAGTSLKVMLQRLVPQSKEAAGMMDRIGFSAYDSTGKFVGLTELAARMKTSFSKLTPEARNAAMATIFGADAVRSATILYELGAEGINRYVRAVDDQGAAGRMASIQTDNLVGDLERLRSAIEVALIEGGSAANGTLRAMTQWVTRLVNAYSSLPPELQRAVTGFMGIGGAAALVGAAILLLIPRIAATRAALVSLGVTAQTTRSALLGLGRFGVVVAGLAAMSWGTEKLISQFDAAPPSVTRLQNSLLNFAKTGKAAGELTKTFGEDLDGFGEAVARIAHPGVLDRVGDSLYTITHLGSDSYGLDDARTKIKGVDEALKGLVEGGAPDIAADAFARMATEAEKQGTSTEKLRTLLPGYAEALTAADTQTQVSAESQAKLAKEAGLTADQLQDQRTEAEKLSDALNTLNGVSIGAAEREISFRQSLADLTETVKDNGRSLDVTTEKGRKVKSAFLDAAQAAMDHAEAVAEQKNSQKTGQKVLEKDISLLRKQMDQAGFSKDAINDLTKAYLNLPGSATTKVDAETKDAIRDLEAVKAKVASTKGKTITMAAPTAEARKQLEALGFKIKNTKGKKVEITVPTGGQKAGVDALRRAIEALRSKTVTLTTRHVVTGTGEATHGSKLAPGHYATGGRVRGYASGGSPVQFAPSGLLSGPGTGTSDSITAVLASGAVARVSNTEFVVNAAATKRYLPLLTALNSGKLPGFAGGGLASGGLAGFTYTPTGRPVLGGPTDAKQRYDQEVADLKKAWADLTRALSDQRKAADKLKDAERDLARTRKRKHTKAQLENAQDRVDDARKAKRRSDAAVRRERSDVAAANRELGRRGNAGPLKGFSLSAYQTQLAESVKATEKWRRNLTRIGQRGGSELQAMLEGMGEEGYHLVNALAGASNKQFQSIVANLTKTGDLAKATLADFTQQLGASTKESQQFAADLQTLAARGFGDLAQALAAQGDASAMTLAHQAATDRKAASQANAQVGKAESVLTGEELAASLTLLSTLRGAPGRGYADLIAAGLDVAVIKAIVPKMTRQIGALPAPYKDTFVRQWVAQGGTAMARGGILSQPTMVLGGEAGVPETWIPWNNSRRSAALLATTAAAMGYQLVPARRYGTAPSAAASAREVTRHIEVHLHGAKQTAAEQAHDIARYITFVG
ncbi:phage tail tape measure protein [Streptomyces sp. NPDC006997]|uniref:phage tail tape measure protein n=1 Tax=Streptomyces sp. NPDC006997 TaxID=3155356 RepID=UPI0033F37F44